MSFELKPFREWPEGTMLFWLKSFGYWAQHCGLMPLEQQMSFSQMPIIINYLSVI